MYGRIVCSTLTSEASQTSLTWASIEARIFTCMPITVRHSIDERHSTIITVSGDTTRITALRTRRISQIACRSLNGTEYTRHFSMDRWTACLTLYKQNESSDMVMLQEIHYVMWLVVRFKICVSQLGIKWIQCYLYLNKFFEFLEVEHLDSFHL